MMEPRGNVAGRETVPPVIGHSPPANGRLFFAPRRADRKGDILGYARVSTADQEDRLRQAGAIRVFVDPISGRRFERPEPSGLIDHARTGDSLCVTKTPFLEAPSFRSGRKERSPL